MTKPTTEAPAIPGTARRTTVSGRPIWAIYTAADLAGATPPEPPGRFPYTRSIHASGYAGKLWTMRQFSGFGTPEETNRRYTELLAAGGTGLSVAFDLPTLMGRDPDHALSLGEVGKCGVSVASLADMERLFDGIALEDVTTSMTINSPAAIIFAMYLVVAQRQGARWSQVVRHAPERHPEGVHRAEGVHLSTAPVHASGHRHVRVLRHGRCRAGTPISVSGYHIREAGATALQELAFTLGDGIEYVQYGVDAGLAGRQLRAAAVVLLQRAQRLLRGDRQVSGGTDVVGDGDARPVRRHRANGRGSCGFTRRQPACR